MTVLSLLTPHLQIIDNNLFKLSKALHIKCGCVYAVSLSLNKGQQQVHRVEFRLDKVASYDLKPGGTSV